MPHSCWLVGIFQNTQLRDIDGLRNLSSVESNVVISDNPMLHDLNGLVGLTSLQGPPSAARHNSPALMIQSNERLVNVDGLVNITTLKGALTLSQNPSLANVEASAAW